MSNNNKITKEEMRDLHENLDKYMRKEE